jgi:hypothetical protein
MYVVKVLAPIGYCNYITEIYSEYEDSEQAASKAYELSCETGLNYFVDFEY